MGLIQTDENLQWPVSELLAFGKKEKKSKLMQNYPNDKLDIFSSVLINK